MHQGESLRELLSSMAELTMQAHFRSVGQFSKEHGLSFPRLSTLFRLHRHGPCSVSDIGAQLEVSNAAASQLIEKLTAEGLIHRIEDPEDRRAKQLSLSGRGRELLLELKARQTAWQDGLEAKLSPEEQATVIKGLALLVHALKDGDAPATRCPFSGSESKETNSEC